MNYTFLLFFCFLHYHLRRKLMYTFSCLLSLLHKKKGGRAWSGNLCEDVVTKCTEDDGFWYTKMKPRLVSMFIVVDLCGACCFAIKRAITLHKVNKKILVLNSIHVTGIFEFYYLLAPTAFLDPSGTIALSICTWFLKEQVRKIKFDKMDF